MARPKSSRPNTGGGDTPVLLERPFAVSELFERAGETIDIEADEVERVAIAKAFGLEELLWLRARIEPRREGGVLALAGFVRARLVQICGVTLEPFENDLEEPIDARFSDDPKTRAARDNAAAGNEADWDDPPEPLPGDHLDLGPIVLEYFALGIDPYPRRPGAVFEIAPGESKGEQESPKSPFAVLQSLKNEKK